MSAGKQRVSKMSTQHNIAPHQRMWANFVRLTMLGAAAVALTLALMALFVV